MCFIHIPQKKNLRFHTGDTPMNKPTAGWQPPSAQLRPTATTEQIYKTIL